MAPSPANDHTILVQRIRSARSALRVTTDLQTRQALGEITAATEDLEELMLGGSAGNPVITINNVPSGAED